MDASIRIVGIGGSLAANSTSLAALNVALEGAVEAGAQTELFDIRELDLPFFSTDARNVPPDADQLCEAVYRAHGLIWSSPLYHGSISGSFKNALDWLQLLADRDPPYLTDKIIGLISTAGGTQGLQAVNTMEFVVRALRGWAVPLVLPISHAHKVFDDNGQPRDARIADQLRGLGQEVVRGARQFATDGMFDYDMAYLGKGRGAR